MIIEDLQRALGEAVLHMRSHSCPYHQHADIGIVTHDGVVVFHGPVCEVPELEVDCEWQMEHREILEKCYEALGTKDMSEFT